MPPERSAALNSLPPDMVRWAETAARDDADAVGTFLRDACGIRGTPDRPVRVPLQLVLDLAGALRLHAWEQVGTDPRQFPGLPDLACALRDVVRQVRPDLDDSGTGLPPGELAARVFDVHLDFFAWCGRPELGADVILGPADEEAVLDALADFLWRYRSR
jgi:hypothetical protein